MNNKKAFIALFLLIVIVFSLNVMIVIVKAENDGTNIEVHEVDLENYIHNSFIYYDEMLLTDAGMLSTDIAKASVALASAAYNQDAIDYALREMGFSKVFDNYGSVNRIVMGDYNVAAYTVSRKRIGENIVYCIPIKGTGQNAEWFSDLYLGNNGQYHEGFYITARKIWNDLISCFKSDGNSRNRRIVWLTGHSRGAALANILGDMLNTSNYTNPNHMFCYTFACPAVSKNACYYSNIFNYNNVGDFVPLLPLESWGYGRFGHTEETSLAGLSNFMNRFRDDYGRDYSGYASNSNWFAMINDLVKSEDDYKDKRKYFDLAIYLFWASDEISWNDFIGYMFATDGLDLLKLGLKTLVNLSNIQAIYRVTNSVLLDMDDLKNTLSSLGDWDIEDITDNSILETINQINNRLQADGRELITDSASLAANINWYETNLSTLDLAIRVIDIIANNNTVFEDVHHWNTYQLWINSIYLGCRGWAGSSRSNLTSEAKVSKCTSLGKEVFTGCSNMDFVIPEQITIVGSHAFEENSGIQQLSLHKNIQYLGDYAFWGCRNVTEVTMPIECSVQNVFNCPNTTAIHYTVSSTGVMPDREYAGDSLESSCYWNLTLVDFEEGIKHIGSYAFYDPEEKVGSVVHRTPMTQITLPASLESIGDYAFYHVRNLQVNVRDQQVNTFPETVIDLGAHCFAGNEAMREVELPPLLQSIDDGLFMDCPNLHIIHFPEGLTSIGASSFENDVAINLLEIPRGVTEVGARAFFGCSGITEITLPVDASVEGAYQCENVHTIHYLCGVTGILPDRIVLERIERLQKIYTFPITLEYSALANLSHVDFEEGIKRIGNYAFCKNKNPDRYNVPKDDICNLTNIVFPSTLESIGDYAFYRAANLNINGFHEGLRELGAYSFGFNLTLTDVQLPSSITEIHDGTFRKCTNMTSVSIPESVTAIGNEAFGRCTGLTEIIIPDSVTSIGRNAFYLCSGMLEITMPVDVSAKGIFQCRNLQKINYTSGQTGVMPDRTPYVPSGAISMIDYPLAGDSNGEVFFQDSIEDSAKNSLSEINFAEGVRHIGDYAMRNCIALTHLVFPDSLESLGDFAMPPYSRIEQNDTIIQNPLPPSLLSIGDECYYEYSLFTRVELNENAYHIGELAFSKCPNLQYAVIPSAMTELSPLAFADNPSLQMVVFSGSLVSIGQGAFKNCTNMIINGLPGPLEYLGEQCFAECKNITQFTIPETVISIGGWAFSGCTRLKLTVSSDNLQEIGEGAFESTLIESFIVPEAITVIPRWLFGYCHQLKSVTLHDGITTIDEDAFSSCDAMDSFTLPRNLTYVGNYAFSMCSGLTGDIEVPQTVNYIGSGAFEYCHGITSIRMPDQITIIYSKTFSDCSNLREISLPSHLEMIEDNAFQCCHKLERIEFPASLKIIKAMAFRVNSGFGGLKEIVFRGDAPAISDNTFGYIVADVYYDPYDHIWQDYKLQNYGGTLTWIPIAPQVLTLPTGLLVIEDEAFMGINASVVEVPEGVISIGNAAFADCANLSIVIIPSSVTTIDENAFNGSTITIKGVSGSTAEEYAQRHGLTFEIMDSSQTNP